jgi:DNA-binding GntR family transcriptional regulator
MGKRFIKKHMDNSDVYFDDLGTKAYKKLKQMILNGELKPGQKLVQEDLAEKLGVSRTPLLQAISKLSGDHFVETVPRRGAYVRRFSSVDKLSIFDIKSQLEPFGAYYAAQNMDEEGLLDLQKINDRMKNGCDDLAGRVDCDFSFHQCIMEHSGNQFLPEILKTYSILLLDSEHILKSMEKTIEEHQAILDAIKAKDANSARELMYYHVNGGARARLCKILDSEEL